MSDRLQAGHAVRGLCALLLLAGLVLMVLSALNLRGPAVSFAPLSIPQIGVGEADEPPTAVFGSRSANSQPLRVEVLGVSPVTGTGRHDRLRVAVGSREQVWDLILGSEIDILGEPYRVAEVRTWQGILPITGGAPMVSVTVVFDSGGAAENILLREGQRVKVSRDGSIELRACANREEALANLATIETSPRAARWGIADDARVTWFDDFTPGTGATLSDGSVVTLESYSPEGPSLVARKRTPEGDRVWRVDGPSDEPPLMLELGSSSDEEVYLYIWEDGRVLGSSPGDGKSPANIEEGQTWDVPGGEFALRLEQSLLSAAPVFAGGSPFFEAVLESGEKRVRVRQGEAVRVGDALLRYVREPDNATAAIELRITGAGDESREVRLKPGNSEVIRWDGFIWSLSHADIKPGYGVAIRKNGGRFVLGKIGLVAVAAAVILLWISRRRAAD